MNKLLILTRQAGLERVEERHPLDNVEAFYAEDKYTLVRLTTGVDTFIIGLIDRNDLVTRSTNKTSYISIKTIGEWLEAHGANQFLKVHRAWLVNMNHVKTYRNPEMTGKGCTLTTYTGASIPSSRRELSAVKWAWRRGVGALATVLLACGLMISSDSNAADKPALPKSGFVQLPPVGRPVIVSRQCSSTGCWVHFSDGTSRFVAGAK